MTPEQRSHLYARIAKYSKANPDVRAAQSGRRRAAKMRAMPSWLTPEHHVQIAALYLVASQAGPMCGEPHEVDHIVPLQSKTVCGLHVPWNLRLLPRFMNREKGNRHV